MMRARRRYRSQAMPEFALVAPVLFLIIFGIFDLGRGIVAYLAIQQAANEGARVAVQGEPSVGGNPPFTPPCTVSLGASCSINPTPNAGAIPASQQNSQAIRLVAAPCPHGPLPHIPNLLTTATSNGQQLPANTGWIFVSEPENITSASWASPATTPSNNAPGGDRTSAAAGSCFGSNPASGSALQVTAIYHFTLTVPTILGLPSNITLVAWSVYETEY